jgi:protein involved in polysaccharide export with SLBB domain
VNYSRTVLRNGRGKNAQPIPERLALKSQFPKSEGPISYKIGVGDTITLLKLIENNQPHDGITKNWPKALSKSNYRLGIGDTVKLTLIKKTKTDPQAMPSEKGGLIITTKPSVDETIISTGRIGSDGSVLLLEVGRLEANGKTLNELRSEVRNILIRDVVSHRFQMEIAEFKSQRAYLSINSTTSVIVLDDKRTTVKDILASGGGTDFFPKNGVGFKSGVITSVRLQRDGKEYSILLRDLYSATAPKIAIKANDHIFVQDSGANIVTTSSIVDHEGNVIFQSVGKIKAAGRNLDELRIEIKNRIQPVPSSQNAFQIRIAKFSSQTALLSIPGKPGVVIKITDSPSALGDVLTENGLSIDGSNIAQINLHRNGKSYIFTLDDLLDPNNPQVYLQPGDRITANILPYKENKVFILGGVSPQIFKINPANRETLADVLFTTGGVLSSSSAKRSEVYLLRGSNPVMAYHLNAQSPTRLIVADTMELRPNDILYVAEQPIISFNRTIGTIIPLRILLRDIQDNNIP